MKLQTECTVENPRPCELATAVGFALDFCRQENVRCEKLEKIFAEGYENEEEVLESLLEAMNVVPESRKLEVHAVLCSVFPQHESCAGIFDDDDGERGEK